MDWKVRALTLVLWLGLVLAFIQNGNAEKRVVCYYTNWSVYRPGTAKFSPQNINPYLCTHLIYAFGGFTKDNTLKPFDKYQDIEKGGYAKFTGLKTYNKNLKTLLAIGGWNEGSSRFSPMVTDAHRRKEFVKNCVKFLRQNHFDGLDLDWEYPAFRDGGKPRDKENYAILVEELRAQFDRESLKTGRPRLLLTMAMPAGIEYIDKGYDVPRLNDNLDFINLLSYDYHSAFEPAVNHHSPLYPLEEDNEYNYDTELTIEFTINHLIKQGASPEKIVLGIPTYGRSYTLFNEDSTDIGSPADGPGTEGDATREKGYLAYYEICESVQKDEWEVVQPNPEAMGPYAFSGNQWVGYDDENIVRVKAKYVNEKNLGGIMFWSIDNDDFRGKCHGRPYPLIEAAKEALLGSSSKREEVKEKTTLRKPTRTQSSQSNSSGRQYASSNRRTSTTTEPPTRKRVGSFKSKNRSTSRISQPEEDEDLLDDEEDDRNALKIVEKPTRGRFIKNRSRPHSSDSGARRKQKNQDSKPAEDSKVEESLSNRLTTPEPPTTPDPGSDFKCEDEGFFPHPRDCKKYFWCLDSGPSGLGVVAHQFTCPSGLVFNKGADSCDYPRNVVCPKVKSGSATTTKAPTTTTRSTTRRTTTEKPEPEEEYEYEDDEEEEEVAPKTTAKPLLYKTISRNRPSSTTVPSTTRATSAPRHEESEEKSLDIAEEEDPRVIKELIDLIKKAGGIEQLEKQLLFQEKPVGGQSGTTSGTGQVTPATISRSLYERVLNRQASKVSSRFFGTSQKPPESKTREENEGNKRSKNGYTNGPGRAQFDGLDDLPEVQSLRRSNKPKYTTIERSRSSPSERIDENEDEEDKNDNADVASSEERSISNPPEEKILLPKVTPSYVNIRRNRPAASSRDNDVNAKEDVEEDRLSSRRRFPVLTTRTEKSISENKDLKSQRNSTNDQYDEFQSPTESEQSVKRTVFPNKKDEESPGKSRYTSIQRFRSTTERQEKSENEDRGNPFLDVTTQTNLNTFKDTTTPEPGSSAFPYTVSMSYSQSSSSSSSQSTSTSTTITTTENPTTQSITIHDEPLFTTKTLIPSISSLNDKLVEDSATEILLTTLPSTSPSTTPRETTTKENLAAVSQPRPFGFTRGRSRASVTSSFLDSTTPLSSATVPSRSKMASSESFQLPTLKQVIAQQTDSAFYGEHNRAIQLSLPPLPLNPPRGFFEEEEEVVDIPIQFLDDPVQDPNKLLLLRIPQSKINKTILHTVLKVRVVDPKSLEKDNSELEDGTNLLTNELLFKEVTALKGREIVENQRSMELEKSATTYRNRRPRVDSSFSQSSPIAQFTEDSVNSQSSMTVVQTTEDIIPANPRAADIQRARRRRVRINSSRVPDESPRNNNPQIRRRPSRRRSEAKVLDTTPTVSITTSRGTTPQDSTTEFPRGFFITKSSDKTSNIQLDNATFIDVQSTVSSFNSSTERVTSSFDEINPRFEKVNSTPETTTSGFEEEISTTEQTISGLEEETLRSDKNISEIEEVSSFDETTSEVKEENVGSDKIFDGKISSSDKTISGLEEQTFTSEKTIPGLEKETSTSEKTISVLEDEVFSFHETTSGLEEETSTSEKTISVLEEKVPNFDEITSEVKEDNFGSDKTFGSKISSSDKTISGLEEEISISDKSSSILEEEPLGSDKTNSRFDEETFSSDKTIFNFEETSTKEADFEEINSDRDYSTTMMNPLSIVEKDHDFLETTSEISQTEKNLEERYFDDYSSPIKTTTETFESEITRFEDTNDFYTPTMVTEKVAVPRRNLRKKIRKIKPVSKEPSDPEKTNSSKKRVRIKKIEFSTETPESSVNTDFILKNLELISRNLQLISGSPEMISDNPELISSSPDMISDNPEISDSKFTTDNPEFTSRKSELDSVSPKFVSRKDNEKKRVRIKKIKFSTEIPESSSINTDLISKNPEFISEVSAITSENSEVSSNIHDSIDKITSTFPNHESMIINSESSTINYETTTFPTSSELLTDPTPATTISSINLATTDSNFDAVVPTAFRDHFLQDPRSKDEYFTTTVSSDDGFVKQNVDKLLNTETTMFSTSSPKNETSAVDTFIKESVELKTNYTSPFIDSQPLSTEKASNITKTIDKTISKDSFHGRRRLLKRKRIDEKLEENRVKVLAPVEVTRKNEYESSSSTTIRSTNTPVTEKPTRKRVVIYRGVKKFSPVTTPSTTTVQRFSIAGDHQNQISSRRRMRKVVRKKPKLPVDDTLESELNTQEDDQSNRKGRNLSINPEKKLFEDAEEAGSEVNSYRTSYETSRRQGPSYRETSSRGRSRTTTHRPPTSLHPSLRRFANSGRQNIHFQETTPSKLSFATVDDATVLLEHLASLEDQKADMDHQANRAHDIQLDNSETTTESGVSSIGTTFWRKISTTESPKSLGTTAIPALRRRQGQKYFNKIITQNLTQRPRRPAIVDYDYYEDEEVRFVGKPRLNGKLYVTSRGSINCLDQGNFPHPISCKKFITCARMVNGQVVGTEYTCPDKLSFDPIGGICNWSAGLGCKE